MIDDLRKIRLDKLEKFRENGGDAYPASSHRTHTVLQAIEGFSEYLSNNDLLVLTGRVMAIREHGGSMFLDLRDGTSSIQCYLKKDEIGEEQYGNFQNLIDIGDFLEMEGHMFLTKREEKTLKINKYRLLAKSLLPLPEKWHGLQDVEERYRKRYLDLLMNDEVKSKFIARSKILNVIRETLNHHNFLEVTTPTLQPLYGGASARPFKTHLNAYDVDVFLRIAPELYLKRLLVGGFERVFEFTTNFRNEGVDREHNPEFSAVEWYIAYKDYEFNMELIEEMFGKIANIISGSNVIHHEDNVINFGSPFRRISFSEIMNEVGYDIEQSEDKLKKEAIKIGISENKLINKDVIIDEIFKKKIRSTLIDPTIVYDYPKSMFPLAKIKPGTNLAEVFQLYAGGFELVKAFTELNDPLYQKSNFEAQENNRAKGDEEAQRMDEDYIEAMEYGMPPNSGVGIGIDRLVALMTNSHSIREIILFPFMKPENSDK